MIITIMIFSFYGPGFFFCSAWLKKQKISSSTCFRRCSHRLSIYRLFSIWMQCLRLNTEYQEKWVFMAQQSIQQKTYTISRVIRPTPSTIQ